MRHPTAQAIEKFNRLFDIDDDSYIQDWEIEAADPGKIDQYLQCYSNSVENDDERFTLMALILGAYEEYHAMNPPDAEHWPKIRSILLADMEIHRDHIDYYQCNDDGDEDGCFPITPLMRSIAIQ
ncbi:hypothetical protein [Oceaniferula spumae]